MGPYDAMRSVWGMVTRQDQQGTLETGKLADFVAYTADPFTCELDELAELEPELTAVLGGRPTWDPQSRMRATGNPR